MKKLIYCAAALATALFAGSCQQEMLDTPATENTVTYTVEIPEVQTKAVIGDGLNVNELIYEVWKTEAADERDLVTDGNAIRLYQDKTSLVVRDGVRKAVITLNLVQDQEYTILFWAQVADAGVYNTEYLTNVHYAKDCEPGKSHYYANQESYAAFYAADFVSDEDPKSKRIELKRPFAQLNIATKNTSEDYDVTVNTSRVVISTVATHFNVAQNIPSKPGVWDSKSFDFKTAGIPTDYPVENPEVAPEHPRTLTVNDQVYEYVAMNYVFANGTAIVSYEINTTLTGTNGTTTAAKVSNTVYNVPLQENYRTNIVGNLLTSTTEYEVVIDKDWADAGDGTEVEVWDGLYAQKPYYNEAKGQYEISLASELAWLSAAVNGTLVNPEADVKSVGYMPKETFEGMTFVLTQDVDLKNAPWTPIGATGAFKGTFDGNNKTIKNLNVKVTDKTPIGLFSNAYSVKNVKVEAARIEGHYMAGVIVGNAFNTRVDNCHVKDAVVTITPLNKDDGNQAGGIVGYLSGEPTGYVTNCSVESAVITAYRDVAGIAGTANVTSVVSGNTIKNVTVVADQTVAYGTDKVANADEIVRRKSDKAVIEENTVENTTAVVKVNTSKNLAYQVNNTTAEVEVVFAANLNGNITVNQQEGKDVVINGNGNNYDGTITVNGCARADGKETLTIKNINFRTSWTDEDKNNDWSFISAPSKVNNVYNYSHNVIIDNCTFENMVDGNYHVGSASFTGSYNLNMKNCTATNMHSILQAQSIDNTVVVDNVRVTDSKSGVAFGNTAYPTLKNSTIDAIDYGVRADANASRGNLVIEKTTITAEKPIIVRKTTSAYDIALTDVTLNRNGIYHVVFTQGADDAAYVIPEATCTISGADNYVVYPLNSTDGNYTNEDGNVVVQTYEGLKNAMNAAQEGDEIVVAAGDYNNFVAPAAKVTVICEEGTVFTGNSKLNINGSTVIGATFSNPSGSAVTGTINGTFTDCVFTGSNGLRNCYVGETCEFNECVFSGDVYGAHFDGSSKTITFNDCEFSGFNAFAAAIELVTFDGCTFKGNGKSGYNGANMWGSAKFIDTEFTFDGTTSNEWVDAIGVDKTYEFTGCTVNGGSILNSSKIFSRNVGTKVTVDGVEYTRADGYFVAGDNAVVTDAAALTAALEAKVPEITLAPGTYEGTFAPKVATSITSASASNKSVIAGRVNVGSIDCSFENIKFEITDASKHKNTYSGAPYQYPGIVVGYGAAMTFEGCDFESSISAGVCGINAGNHADSSDLLTVNNCTFVGDFYAIRTRSLCNITNNVFDIYTDQGTLAAVWTWGNANSGANKVTFTGNTNQNANQVYSVQMTASNFVYDYVTINVQNNTNFCALADGVNPARFNGTHTFVEGSETF